MKGNYTFEDGITVNASDAQRANEKHDKVTKCEYCKGTGLVQIAPNVRGLKKCTFCSGKLEPKVKGSRRWGRDNA